MTARPTFAKISWKFNYLNSKSSILYSWRREDEWTEFREQVSGAVFTISDINTINVQRGELLKVKISMKFYEVVKREPIFETKKLNITEWLRQ